MLRKLIDAQRKPMIVDDQILALDEAVRLHCVEERDIVRRIARTEMQVTEAIGSSRLLRPGGEGQGGNRSPE